MLASLVVCAVTDAGAGPAAVAVAPPTVRLAALSVRAPDALTGSQFLEETKGWSESERQRAALGEFERGNMPRFLDRLRPVRLSHRPPRGEAITATVWVTADYLAVGSDDDFLYVPLTRPSANRVAERFGCVLPTPRIVDAIYEQARVQMTPQPLPAGPRMASNAYYARHQQLIAAQRAGTEPGVLVSGHKKDLVVTNRLLTRPDRVAIYGWHRGIGKPIQPLSTVHGAKYADYSHGVRLVWHEVEIDSVRRSIYDVLADPELAPVLTREGALRDAHALMESRRRETGALAASPPGSS